MARREKMVVIDAEGRDKGKAFFIIEMPAHRAERWAIRAFLALANGGIEVPDDISSQGMAGIASMGLKALGGLKFEAAEPLLDEMWGCIQYVPDMANPAYRNGLVNEAIEEPITRLRLRKEVLALHTGFSLGGATSA